MQNPTSNARLHWLLPAAPRSPVATPRWSAWTGCCTLSANHQLYYELVPRLPASLIARYGAERPGAFASHMQSTRRVGLRRSSR